MTSSSWSPKSVVTRYGLESRHHARHLFIAAKFTRQSKGTSAMLSKKLFLIQDSDRLMHIVAADRSELLIDGVLQRELGG